jgi:hypothetical protein
MAADWIVTWAVAIPDPMLANNRLGRDFLIMV